VRKRSTYQSGEVLPSNSITGLADCCAPAAVAQLDKAMTVAKLRGTRERKRRENG
jgi:hypothetical protein